MPPEGYDRRWRERRQRILQRVEESLCDYVARGIKQAEAHANGKP